MRNRVTQMLVHMVMCAGTFYLGSLPLSAVAQDTAKLPYLNPQLSPERRAPPTWCTA